MLKMSEIIFKKLEELDKKYKKSGDNFIISQCLNPNHHDNHPSFSINLETGAGFCFTCGFKVDYNYWTNGEIDDDFIRDLEYNSLLKSFESKKEDKPTKIFLPPFGKALQIGWRSLTEDTINKNGLYICLKGLYKNRVIFPMYYNDELKGFTSRTLVNDTPKYLYAKGMDLKSLIYPNFDYAEELVIVEGVMDALSLIQDGIPAIMNFGLAVNFNEYKIKELLKKGVNKLWLMFDNDKYGKKANYNFKYSFLNKYFDIDYAFNNAKLKEFYKSGCKDYNEFINKTI